MLSFILTFLLIVPFLFVYIQGPFEFVKSRYFGLRKRFRFLNRLNIVMSTASMYFRYNRKLGLSAFLYSMLLTIPSMFLNGMALYLIIEGFGIHLVVGNIAIVLFIFS